MFGYNAMFNKITRRITDANKMDSKNVLARALKLAEEAGEVCEAVLATEGIVNNKKHITKEDLIEENVDVIINALSIIYMTDRAFDAYKFNTIFDRKMTKWENGVKEG